MSNLKAYFKCARDSDIESIIKIMRDGYYKCWDKKFFKSLIKNRNSIIYILENSEGVLGFVAANHSGAECDIIMLMVDIKKRRSGFGSMLIQNILLLFKDRGITNVYLEVAQNNIAAIRLYEKYGFKKIHIRKSYYKFGDTMIDAGLYAMVNI